MTPNMIGGEPRKPDDTTIKRSLMQALRVRGQSHQEQHINTLALYLSNNLGQLDRVGG
jgi:hypothetical protein